MKIFGHNFGVDYEIEKDLNEAWEGSRFLKEIHHCTNAEMEDEFYYQVLTQRHQSIVKLLQEHARLNCNTMPQRITDKNDPVYAETNEVKFKNKYIEEVLRIPVLKGSPNADVQKNINNSIKNDIMEFKKEMEEEAVNASEQAKAEGKKFIPFSISNVYQITYNKNNIISITLLYNEFVNGKSYYIKTSYNYDMNSGKSLALKDLFREGSNYLTTLNNAIRNQLLKNKSQYFPESIANFKGIAEDQPFYLEDNNIVIFFRFNEIAPMESQIPVIRIPFDSVRNILKLGFL